MIIPIYIKMDAKDQLLLSETVRAVVPKQLQKHKRGNPVMNSTARKKVKSSAKNRTAVKKVQTARVQLDLERGVM